ncbi:ABC transporter ATP-binding protein [Denitrobaculum tricleocarpae]|uniref:ABC transporter ATP-binding protein n=1 Tax=Denitrobaculum tricleocarpae TaxID=2591009 RepID=A0A545TKR0_9PROT|nr:ABC transporter ATP-binding protein [Denitrobaculum tricleocarpae]TQV77812.1 ABC transporter ATP-binding protein [Denitrobaculum tricleocarpae]
MTLNVKDLEVALGGAAIVKRASLSCAPGQFAMLIGPNGAGKSTLLKALSGLLPSRGHVSLKEATLGKAERQEVIAYMPQDIGPTSSLTVLEVILLGRLRSLGLSVPGDLAEAAQAALARFGLAALQGRTLDAISGGQRQLLFLAQALFRQPDVLLLDEPTAALDLRHQLVVLEAVRKHCTDHGTIAIAAMHDLTLAAQFADQMICLSQGRIEAKGPPENVLTVDRLQRVYGVEAEISLSAQGRPNVMPLRAS